MRLSEAQMIDNLNDAACGVAWAALVVGFSATVKVLRWLNRVNG